MMQTVVITGASSGIGAALAERYAQLGARLGLLGRDHHRLAAVAEQCRVLGAETHTGVIEVGDRAGLTTWLDKFDRDTPVDILIANAGVVAGASEGEPIETAEISRLLIETNVVGVLNTIHPLLPRMLARGRGNIAIMSSIGGFVPLPQMASYSASKSAVLTYGLALRAALRSRGIGVSVICPGYVDTPMTARIIGPKPFLMSAERAAERIQRGIARNRAIIAFPAHFALAMRLMGFLPDWARRCTAPFVRFRVSPQQMDPNVTAMPSSRPEPRRAD
jgi:short-subunit dehydrogenase